MKKLQFSLIILALLTFISSCTMEKRVYLPGFHVMWKKNIENLEKQEHVKLCSTNTINKHVVVTEEKNPYESSFIASTDNNIDIQANENSLKYSNINKINKDVFNYIENNSEDCDIIILKNGQEIKAKVIEIGQNEVKYKDCFNQSGPTFIKNKSEIFMIKYPNGTSTVIEEIKQNTVNSNVYSPPTNSGSDKNLTVAVLLWLFLGLLGIHRFYLGHIGMGVLYLLTGGLCGLGWLIDGILFLTGGLKPKNGKYVD